LMAKHDTLKTQLTRVKSELSNIPIVDQTSIDVREARLLKYKQYIASKKRLDDLTRELSMIPNPGVNEIYEEKDRVNAIRQEQNYISNEMMANVLSIKYDQGTILNEIAKLKELISYQAKFEANDRINNLEVRVNGLKAKLLDKPTASEIDALKATAQSMIQTRDVIKCPGCNCSVRYSFGTLHLANADLFDQEAYNKISSDIVTKESQLNISRDLANAERDLLLNNKLEIIPSNITRVPVNTLYTKM